MKVYVASSWRNKYYEDVLKYFKESLAGLIEFYDFRNPEQGNSGFSWREIEADGVSFEKWETAEYLHALEHPTAEQGFKFDFDAMKGADACVLILPCGRSAHLEAGYFVGAGKPLLILIPEQIEPELMYKMTPYIFEDAGKLSAELFNLLKTWAKRLDIN